MPAPRLLVASLLPLLPLVSAGFFTSTDSIHLHPRFFEIRDEASSNLTSSLQVATQQFVDAGFITPDAAKTIVSTIKPQIKEAAEVIASDPTASTISPDAPVSVASDASTSRVYSVAVPTTGSDETSAALQDIGQSVADALAALDLARKDANLTSLSDLGECFKAIFSAGGLSSDATCVTASGSTAAGLHSLFNTVLEQFVGIIPNKIVDALQSATDPIITGLLPAEQSFNDNINAAFKSVTASLSGNLVTAVQAAQKCFTETAAQQGNIDTAQCFMRNGAYGAYQNALNGAVEQFMGVLPPNILNDTLNIYAYHLSNDNSTSGMSDALKNALQSVVASVSGNTVSSIQALQRCMNQIIQMDSPPAYVDCLKADGNPMQYIQTEIAGMLENFAGYLPSTVIANIKSSGSKYTSGNTSSADSVAYQDQVQWIFANYIACVQSIQGCVANNMKTGNSTDCAASKAACDNLTTKPAPVPAPAPAPIAAGKTKAITPPKPKKGKKAVAKPKAKSASSGWYQVAPGHGNGKGKVTHRKLAV